MELLFLLVDTVAPSLSFEATTLDNFSGGISVGENEATLYSDLTQVYFDSGLCPSSEDPSPTYDCVDKIIKQPIGVLVSGANQAFHIQSKALDPYLLTPTAQFYLGEIKVGNMVELIRNEVFSEKYRATLPLEAIASTGIVPDSVTITASDKAGNRSSFTVKFALTLLAGIVEMTDVADLGPAGVETFGLEAGDAPLSEVFNWPA